jgi:hypothetical protein
VDKKCLAGKCQITERTNLVCDDGLKCTTGDKCQAKSLTDLALECKGTALDCDDENVCTTDSCDAATGVCVNSNNTVACEDGSECTIDDQCKAGVCAPGAVTDCDDGNDCTTDSCDATTGVCVNVAMDNSIACDDGNACTLQDACMAGECVGAAKICNDHNPCTADVCYEETGTCGFKNLDDGVACDDGVTPVGDVCVSGTCVPGGDWCNSGDADQCCLKLSGSQHQVGICQCSVTTGSDFGTWEIKTSCGYYETQDTCKNNSAGVPTCGGPCTPVCDAKVCGDDCCGGSCGTCTTDKVCNTAGACVACLVDANCDDSNPCTTDSCAANACGHLNVTDHTGCGTGKECMAGACVDLPPAPECDATHACPTGEFCWGTVCLVLLDQHGRTDSGASGANGGQSDQKDDRVDWDCDKFCASITVPCIGVGPTCPAIDVKLLQLGDCDEIGKGNFPGMTDWVGDNYDNDCNGTVL